MKQWAARALAWRLGRTGPAEFAGLFVVGLFMAAIGAFDTDPSDPLRSNAYWVTVMIGGGVIAALIEPLLWKVPALAKRPPLLAVAQALAMTPPITLMVWLVSAAFAGRVPNPRGLAPQLISVLIVDIGVVILAVLVRRATARIAHPAQPATPFAPPPAIAEKLPPRLARADLIAVQAEDHYLRIHTAAGNALILMRFVDALAALEGADGVQTHRSWWVARRAVDETRWNRGRGELRLGNGLVAPVSRSFAAGLRDASWA
jgi:hypothetical protein